MLTSFFTAIADEFPTARKENEVASRRLDLHGFRGEALHREDTD
jgi:hypothetical protein